MSHDPQIQETVNNAAASVKTLARTGQASLGEVGEFARGNVEAMFESTKILANGLHEMRTTYLAEGKRAFETMTANAKELASAKTATEFFEKHTGIVRRSFDAAVAKSSESGEAMFNLSNAAFQPISSRMTAAMDKVKKAA